jgi:hypothetical protein
MQSFTPKDSQFGKRSFFKELRDAPTTTMGAQAGKFDFQTPKGEIPASPFGAGGVNRDRKSMAVAQTPKTVGGMGLDLNLSKLQGVPEAEAQDEDTARGKPD